LIVNAREGLRTDGPAFKATYTEAGQTLVAYIFRVHELLAVVEERGVAGAIDLQSQAL
jgi:hypothetical protein